LVGFLAMDKYVGTVARAMVGFAKHRLKHGEDVAPQFSLIRGGEVIMDIVMPVFGTDDKYTKFAKISVIAGALQCDAVVTLIDAWMSVRAGEWDPDKDPLPRDDPDRKEALFVNVIGRDGEWAQSHTYERREDGSVRFGKVTDIDAERLKLGGNIPDLFRQALSTDEQLKHLIAIHELHEIGEALGMSRDRRERAMVDATAKIVAMLGGVAVAGETAYVGG
jgi:hypothetical protein